MSDTEDAAAILRRLDERSEVQLRILRALEDRVASMRLPNATSASSLGPNALGSTLSPDDFGTDEPCAGADELAGAAPCRHADPTPAEAGTPVRMLSDSAVSMSPSGHSPTEAGEPRLLEKLSAAEQRAKALEADKEALWDQLEAVEEAKAKLARDKSLLEAQIVELKAALSDTQARLAQVHDESDLDEFNTSVLSRSPSASAFDGSAWRATPLLDGESGGLPSAATGATTSPAPSGNQTQGEATKFGFKLRYPNLPTRKRSKAALKGPQSRRVGQVAAARAVTSTNRSFPASPLTAPMPRDGPRQPSLDSAGAGAGDSSPAPHEA